MKVYATMSGGVQDSFWQDQPISNDDCRIEIQRSKPILLFLRFQAFRMANVEALLLGKLMDRRRRQFFASARRTWWLRVNADDFMSRINQ